MTAALALGRRGQGTTAPNPAVGCVIVQGQGDQAYIVGRGWTAPGGRPHAETVAIERAGIAARGATAYVSLEPCCHHGRTPPCTDALIAAGISRVVTPLDDPDKRVGGQGHERLRAAGIAVTTGVLESEARRDHAGYLSRTTRGRPHVILKLAVSADGKIAAAGRSSPNMITGPLARARGHLIRARTDAIMVGMGTVIADDPDLTCRLPGLEERSPVRVVVTTGTGLPPGCRLASMPPPSPVWLLTSAADAAATPAEHPRIVSVAAKDGGVDLADVLVRLAENGINSLLVEGGARLAGSLVALDLVDEVALFVAPDDIGGAGLTALGNLPLEAITASSRFLLRDELMLGRDRLIAYDRAR